jgi:hypothetical protein
MMSQRPLPNGLGSVAAQNHAREQAALSRLREYAQWQ